MTIVVGFVPTAEGRAAMRAAIVEAQQHSESVLVVNSVTGDTRVDRAFASEKDLAQVRVQLDESGVPYEIVQNVGAESGAEGVLHAAASSGARAIVIGIRRRSPSGKFFFGSSSQQILLEADCPVLAVKAFKSESGRSFDD